MALLPGSMAAMLESTGYAYVPNSALVTTRRGDDEYDEQAAAAADDDLTAVIAASDMFDAEAGGLLRTGTRPTFSILLLLGVLNEHCYSN